MLYEHYFSALLGFNILNDIITKDKKNYISVKLFTKEEDEEKQKKVHNMHNLHNLQSEQIESLSFMDDRASQRMGQIQSQSQGGYQNPWDFKTITKPESSSNNIPLNGFNGRREETLLNGKNSYYTSDPFYPTYSGVHNSFSYQPSDNSEGFFRSKEKDEEILIEGFFDNFSTMRIEDKEKPKKIQSDKKIEIEKKKDEEKVFTSNEAKVKSTEEIKNFKMVNDSSMYFPASNRNFFHPGMVLYPNMSSMISKGYITQPVQPMTFPLQFLPENTSYLANPQLQAQPTVIPNNTFPSQYFLLKFVCNYEVQIENETTFRVTKRLIGNKGLALKRILFDSCNKFGDYTTKIRLRGKGSGYKEVTTLQGKYFFKQLLKNLNFFRI